MASAKPGSLHALFPRELLVAPRPTVALAGGAEVHGLLSDRLRASVSITGSSVSLKATDMLFGAPWAGAGPGTRSGTRTPRRPTPRAEAKEQAAVDPLAPPTTRAKGLLKADTFHRFQRLKPAVVLAFIDRWERRGCGWAGRDCAIGRPLLTPHLPWQPSTSPPPPRP